LELVSRNRSEHRVDVLHEVERLGVEQHVLLFDTEGVRVAFPERVVEHAAALREAAALARDRCRVDLLHTPSISALDALRTIDEWGARTAAAGVTRADGEIGAHGPRDAVLRWASITKLATGLALLVALEEG